MTALPAIRPNAKGVLITGSIAYDTVLSTPQRFEETLRPEGLAHLNLTFPTPKMTRTYGGCAANIAWALRVLGGKPLLWSALGKDGEDYRKRFEAWNLDLSGLAVLDDCFTSQCFITTDAAGNQLAAFHAGALDRADEAPMPPGAKFAILSPGERRATLAQAAACRDAGIPYLFDPGQATPLYGADGLRNLLEGAFGVAYSDYEAELIQDITGITPEILSAAGKTVWLTHGAKGSSIWLPGSRENIAIPAPKLEGVLHSVGAGDAYRGGLLYALARGLSAVCAAEIGTIVASCKLGYPNSQGYFLNQTQSSLISKYESLAL